EAAAIIADALRERAKNKVVIRIIYDATTEPDGETVPAGSLAHLEADKKAPGTETFVRSFADIAQIKGITGYRVLMHSKYLVRDSDVDNATIFLGSANYTNDSWGLQENNLLQLRSRLWLSVSPRTLPIFWRRERLRKGPPFVTSIPFVSQTCR